MAVKKSILENVIKGGRFELSRVTELIETGYAQGAYSEEEREQLMTLRDQYLKSESQKPEAEEAYRMVLEEVALLRQEVAGLKTKVEALAKDNGTAQPEPEQPEMPAYPAWKPWDGVSRDYQPGAIVSHKDKLWLNVLEGMQNTWEPGTIGTERMWVEYVPETEQAGEVILE